MTTHDAGAAVFRRALVLTSAGPAYADPWHDLRTTSAAVAAVVTAAGLGVEVRDDVVDALEEHAGRSLLVVNVSGAPEPPEEERVDAARVAAALRRHVAAGAPVLGVHSAALAFGTVPLWREVLGARWVHGRSWHPDLGVATAHVAPVDHPVTAGLADFRVEDERYTDLDPVPGRLALVSHEEGGRTHPLVLVGTVGRSRVVLDALGHDGRSYASPERRALLRREARWAAGLDPAV